MTAIPPAEPGTGWRCRAVAHLQGQDKYNKGMFQTGEQADVAGVYTEHLKKMVFSLQSNHTIAWIHGRKIHVLGKPNAWNKT